MNLNLLDKVALVTGASSGIGAATARVFAEEGADVVVVYHENQEGAAHTVNAVRETGRQAQLCKMDLRDPSSVAEAIRGLPEPFRRLDAVVLCAGKNKVTTIESIKPVEWDDILAVNLSGPFTLVQALLPLLVDGAALVTVSSVAGHTGNPNHMHYAAAKAGLMNLTKSLARALAPKVRVNCVAPGVTLTPMGEGTVDPTYPEKNLLVPRFATPEEIARCIVFTASPLTAFMTGATIDINGGRDLR
jgi:3-oxoacyl-[acyl-carrier protein] reductase